MLYTVILSIKSQYYTPKQQIAANDKINGKKQKKKLQPVTIRIK